MSEVVTYKFHLAIVTKEAKLVNTLTILKVFDIGHKSTYIQ